MNICKITTRQTSFQWTLKRRVFFILATACPLLFAYSMTQSNGILWFFASFYDPASSEFSFWKFIYYSWLEFLDNINWNLSVFLSIFFGSLYICWWYKPNFIKSYLIGLLVFIFSGYFSSLPFHAQEESFKELLTRFPEFVQSLPIWFQFLLKIWPA